MTAPRSTATIRQRRDRAAEAFANVARDAEILAERMTQLASRMQFIYPADRAAIDAAIGCVTAAGKQCRYLSVRAKGPT